ncbi:MAG: signal recognition particle receptor subunit alpha, partial [Terracidiphilus sp.]
MMKLFGGKRNTPEPETPDAQPAADEQPKSGLFSRLKQAVSRTRESLSTKIEGLVALTRTVDAEALDDLEAALLTSDLGVETTQTILEALRDRARRQAIEGGEELRALLKEQLRAIMEAPQRPHAVPEAPPRVTFLVGVNGTGKTTTSGKLAALYVAKGRKALLCAADTF